MSCGRNGYAEDECTIAYISDGGGSAMQSQNTEFLPFAIHGKIDASFEPKWVTLFSEKPIDNNVVTGIGSVANYTDAYGQLHYLWAQAQRASYYSSFAAEPEYRRWSPYFNAWTEPFEFAQIDSGNAYTLSEFFYDPQWNYQRRQVLWALRQY